MPNTSSNNFFHSYLLGDITLQEVVQEIERFVKLEPKRFYKIIVGSDSSANNRPTLVTAVTLWRVGNGGIHFWTTAPYRKYNSLHERIWEEAMRSITLAQELRSLLRESLGDEFFWDGNEVHVDIGPNGKTKDLIDGITGMIRGYQFEPVIKPFAFGASVVADKHT